MKDDNSEVVVDIMGDNFLSEMMGIFLIEYRDLIDAYADSLQNIENDILVELSYKELFRVYHTLKGNTAFFPEYKEFTHFTKYYCELLRYPEKLDLHDPILINTMKTNATLLITILNVSESMFHSEGKINIDEIDRLITDFENNNLANY
ncbi:MAG: hypothetical protein OEY49_13200 [Candidatus Heimdallarchaeota archaeon]|nr:hypothetical protein [Candidatus Heimdallarchaeota archaeon]